MIVTNEGIQGLHDPEWELQTSSSPGRAGRRRLHARTQQRSFRLPVYMWDDDGSREWLDLYRAFFHSFHPERPGTLTVRTLLGARTIELYYDGACDFSYTQDPIFRGASRYPLNLTAEDPYWKGPEIVRAWEDVAPQQFFGSGGNLWVSAGSALAEASIEHDGDVSSWVDWIVRARADQSVSAVLTANGGTVGTPTIPAGGELVIRTDPTIGSAELNGAEVDGQVDPWNPRPIPEGGPVPLSLVLTGSGTVELRLQPRYWRGF